MVITGRQFIISCRTELSTEIRCFLMWFTLVVLPRGPVPLYTLLTIIPTFGFKESIVIETIEELCISFALAVFDRVAWITLCADFTCIVVFTIDYIVLRWNIFAFFSTRIEVPILSTFIAGCLSTYEALENSFFFFTSSIFEIIDLITS